MKRKQTPMLRVIRQTSTEKDSKHCTPDDGRFVVACRAREVRDASVCLFDTPAQLWDAWMITIDDGLQEKFRGGTEDLRGMKPIPGLSAFWRRLWLWTLGFEVDFYFFSFVYEFSVTEGSFSFVGSFPTRKAWCFCKSPNDDILAAHRRHHRVARTDAANVAPTGVEKLSNGAKKAGLFLCCYRSQDIEPDRGFNDELIFGSACLQGSWVVSMISWVLQYVSNICWCDTEEDIPCTLTTIE